LLYHLHLAKEASLEVKPFMDDRLHGVFATRAPARPNPIGLSVVRLMGVEGNRLHIRGVLLFFLAQGSFVVDVAMSGIKGECPLQPLMPTAQRFRLLGPTRGQTPTTVGIQTK